MYLNLAAYLFSGIAGAGLIAVYQVMSARLSQMILLDLRKRVFLHTQRLSLEFHESYTSGRIIWLSALVGGGLFGFAQGQLISCCDTGCRDTGHGRG